LPIQTHSFFRLSCRRFMSFFTIRSTMKNRKKQMMWAVITSIFMPSTKLNTTTSVRGIRGKTP